MLPFKNANKWLYAGKSIFHIEMENEQQIPLSPVKCLRFVHHLSTLPIENVFIGLSNNLDSGASDFQAWC